MTTHELLQLAFALFFGGAGLFLLVATLGLFILILKLNNDEL